MATFTTSPSVPQEKHDVFVSFRGPDTRRGFLSHLRKQFQQKGIKVYVDETAERGDTISPALSEAIERSRIALVIFSENYASSRWCLEELVKIMQCRQDHSQIVIPVFYDIDPSNVRRQKGSYEGAFVQHRNCRVDSRKLQDWRSVLKETADIFGYHNSSNFRDEADLIDEIIKDACKKLEGKGKDTVEPKDHIGIEKNLTPIELFMEDESHEVRVFGIWGKGGIGKTTLAHATFGNFYHQFDRSYFAENVREKSKKIGMDCLLEEILSVLLDEEKPRMVGKPNIQRRLRRTRVLLVLDDVDTSSQLQYLIDENLSLGPSSKVIITSRDRHVLISGGVHEVHEVKELGKEESLQLFCRHAFKQGHPKQGYEKLSMQVIEYAKDRLVDKALITISRDDRVEIHDLLQEMAKEIVREESREHPESRSRLHDAEEVRDVLENNKGTNAIEGIALNPEELESDIHLSAEAFKKMSNLRFLKIYSSFNQSVKLPFGLESLPNKLRYFYWDRYPLKTLPLGFCTDKLVEIHMPVNRVIKLWDGVQDLMNLKIISLVLSVNLKELPDFSGAQNLEMMDLEFCQSLCSIHPSIFSLPKLVSLNLMGCYKLKNLHTDNHLKSLKELQLTCCFALEEFLLSSEEMRSLHLASTGIKTLNLPVGRFNKLEELYLGGHLRSFQVNELSCLTSLKIFSLDRLRGRIGKSKLVILFDAWCSLEELTLRYCGVSEIPDNINAMSLLKILSLRGSSVESLPDSIKHLSGLREIDLGQCKRLRSLPELPPSLAYCYLDECQSLETFDFPLMRAIHNFSEVRVCYPGSTIPGGFKYSLTTAKSSISIELAPASSDHLLGFASYCILSTLCPKYFLGFNGKFHFEDEKIYWDDNKFNRFEQLSTDHVFLRYDPMDHMVKENQRRRFDENATCKFRCKFNADCFYPSLKYDPDIKGCGIWPIYASEIQEKMELRLETNAVTGSTRQYLNVEYSCAPEDRELDHDALLFENQERPK
ncbi:disease resistance protein RPP2A-like [Neltuma alba]|uniref:disease resistance protein RPP2A-like n=1 Tax=Neltuma alba TaxID=207710 RepID=UPI0010A3163F|nr:disease resistance protein RPP2A-like [Prosopis alba]